MTQAHRIGGRYELGELLGRGGMAEVRKGTDVRLGRTVAVKRLRTDLASDNTFQARFRREAQSSAALNHPAIVAVYDTGEEIANDGTGVAQPYIVMEYVSGRTLRDIIREGRKILPERALEITSGVLSALDYSHRAGIIHRDIKPANVMLTPAGDVKVMDFGIARAVADSQSTMTQTAAVVGTAQYLSPEQARGENVDSRSDVYSAGCLLYELLTGRPPFVGDSPVSVAYQHVREEAPPPSSLDSELPPEIDAIVMKALAKPLQERYQSAAAMRADIDRYLAGKPVQAPAVPSEAQTTFIPADSPTAVGSVPVGVADEDEDIRRRRGPLILLALLLLTLIALAAVFGPRLISGAPNQISVPRVVRMSQAAAERTLIDNKLRVGTVGHAASASVPKGQVISQNPPTGKLVNAGSAVNLIVSDGKPAVTLPDVKGENKDTAAALLRGMNLNVKLVKRPSDQTADNVIAMTPPAHQQVAAGALVTLFYSAGPNTVPAVVGKTDAQATALITGAGFRVNRIFDSTTKATKGTVLQQGPKAGQPANHGSTVTIVVSTYQPPPTQTPTPTPSQTPTPTPTPSGSPTGTPTGTPTP
ncbi:MAG: Stk1 family PASTA domain-containing Ser/Thr kinase [Actinomycetota bacterium]|nr:Stk1 family PASTA domain-containing Ser/Thr kinase [Actinomycetota bacterium]